MIELEKKMRIEKEMGVNIDNQLKFSNHIEMHVNKGNKLLGLMHWLFTYLIKNSILIMYKQKLVRSFCMDTLSYIQYIKRIRN